MENEQKKVFGLIIDIMTLSNLTRKDCKKVLNKLIKEMPMTEYRK